MNRRQHYQRLALAGLLAGLLQPASAADPRIVTAGGAVTEMVYALGAGDRVVGVDISSLFPPAVAQVPHIGYLRTLSAEGILALRPDVLLTTPEAGPAATLEHLRASRVTIETVPSGFTPAAVEEKIRRIARSLDIPEAGERLLGDFRRNWQATQAAVAGYADRPRVLFVLAHAGGSPMVAGRGTAADAMIALAGAENAAATFDGYKPLTAEAAVAAHPEVILITDEGMQELGGRDSLWANPALRLTPAGQQRRAVAMDSLTLLGFGPRLPTAVRELAARLRTPAS